MATLHLDHVTLALRSFRLELTLDVRGTIALVGPSGAGKTSVLHAIAGLRRIESGRVAVDTEDWTALPPERRAAGLVFQDYALFPHLNVRQNVEFGGPAGDLLERLRIDHLAAERPAKLSGGERQRVAVARALARNPQVLLLDEPLAALDAYTRTEVRSELHELLATLDIPVLLVTHDFEDAAALAHQVGVLIEGKLRQLGTPAELVAAPADPFVASFTGANVLTGWAAPSLNGSTRVKLADGTEIATADAAHGEVAVAVYPWEITLSTTAPHDSALNVIHAPIRSVVELGNRVRVTLGPVSAEVTAESAARLGLRPGQDAYASFKATGTRVL
ncbi:MAG TPA: ABC transporter ATP-binding protein [Gaiellaceae bacterium]|jgi:ABC-type Fe3+/spermidine/putrescine transport system ATPase subunit